MRKEPLQLFSVESTINDFTIYCPQFSESPTCLSRMHEVIKCEIHSYTYDNFPVFWQFDDVAHSSLMMWRFDMDNFYEQAIKDFKRKKANQDTDETEEFIFECFFEKEAKALLGYLNQAEGDVRSFITEIDLPVENYISVRSCYGANPNCYIIKHTRDGQTLAGDLNSTWGTWPFPDDTLLPFDVYSSFFHPLEYEGVILKEKKVIEIMVDSKQKQDVDEWRKECNRRLKLIPPMTDCG